MTKPDIVIQVKTVLSSLFLAILGASAVVFVGLMARPSLSDVPSSIGPTAGVVKATTSTNWADRADTRLR